MKNIFTWFFVFLPIAIIAHLAGASPILQFFLAAIGIVPFSKLIGDATESLASRTNAAWGGLLNVTFGNATELIIGIFAIRTGLIEIVKASLTGSIIGNLLLVLGTSLAVGGIRYKEQEFNRTAALASGSTLFLAVVALIMPALLPMTVPNISRFAIENMSVLTAIGMITMYAFALIFSLHTHKHLYELDGPAPETNAEEDKKKMWSANKSLFVLLIAAAGIAYLSNILVHTIEPLAEGLGWTQSFIGVVILAAVGNVAEHASAVVMAARNKMTLAIEIAMGSATQIAMFVAPVLVIASLFLPMQMDLIFSRFELASIVLSVVIVNMVLADGESNWLEGVQLVIAYLIVAVAFFLHP